MAHQSSGEGVLECCRAVGASLVGGHIFGRLVNPFSTRGQIIPTTLLDTCPHPVFRPSFGPVLEGKEERRDVRRDNGL